MTRTHLIFASIFFKPRIFRIIGCAAESIVKVSIVIISSLKLLIVIQKVMQECVINASRRSHFRVIFVARFKIQLIELISILM